ncbi:radical SAM protein [Streptomyces sp. NPDC059134]|uniref:radical SAM protein n=1 Tax=Streptomyces sp. NPDC059134 TaxID=3346738 RepID=UPI0036BA9931
MYFTGGEPLTSRLARPVLTQLPVRGPDMSYTLITNGLLVRAHRDWLATTALDKVKVSLHYFSDESFRAIAQTRYSVKVVLDGIEAAREVFERVELNALIQSENEHELRDILAYALERRLPVQFIELVDTDFNAGRKSSAVGAQGLINHLRTLTAEEEEEVSGVGHGLPRRRQRCWRGPGERPSSGPLSHSRPATRRRAGHLALPANAASGSPVRIEEPAETTSWRSLAGADG